MQPTRPIAPRKRMILNPSRRSATSSTRFVLPVIVTMDLNNCEGLRSTLSDLLRQCDLSDADGARRDGVDIRGGLAVSRPAQQGVNLRHPGAALFDAHYVLKSDIVEVPVSATTPPASPRPHATAARSRPPTPP